MQTLAEVFPSNKLAIRLSPFSTFQAMREADPYETFIPWAEKLMTTWPDLAYVHVIESRVAGSTDSDTADEKDTVQPFREIVEKRSGGKTKFMTAGGWDPKAAAEHSKQFPDDLIAFGRYFIGKLVTGGSCVCESILTNLVLQPTPICLRGSSSDTLADTGTEAPFTRPVLKVTPSKSVEKLTSQDTRSSFSFPSLANRLMSRRSRPKHKSFIFR